MQDNSFSQRVRKNSLLRSNVKHGYLYKKPLKAEKQKNSLRYALKGWKKRWFVLKKTCLYYFKNEKVGPR